MNNIKKYWVIILTVALHIAVAFLPFVNFEWAFSDASRYFITQDASYINEYFLTQANTLALPILSAGLSKLLFFIPVAYLPRVFAITGYVFLGAAIMKLHKRIDSKIPLNLLLILIFLNPLFWIFAGRGTADFFPAALGIYALSGYFGSNENRGRELAYVILLSAAITVKYHAIFLFVPIAIEILLRPYKTTISSIFTIVMYGLLTILLPVIYIIIVKLNFGFWITPPVYLSRHGFDSSSFFSNFVIYLGYSALLLMPLSLFECWSVIVSWWKENKKKYLLVTAILSIAFFLTGYLWVRPIGEMNFGPLDGLLGAATLGGCFTLLAGIMALVLFKGFRSFLIFSDKKRYGISLIALVLIFTTILSFARPAQRYLMFILPVLYFCIGINIYRKKMLFLASMLFYITINILLSANQYASGAAAEEMTVYLKKHNILPITQPGEVAIHVGHEFYRYDSIPKRFAVISSIAPEAVFTTTKKCLLIQKTYSLIPIKKE